MDTQTKHSDDKLIKDVCVFVLSPMAALMVFGHANKEADSPRPTIWSLGLRGQTHPNRERLNTSESPRKCAQRILKTQLGFDTEQIYSSGVWATTALFFVIWEGQTITPNANIIRWQWCHADETPSFIADHYMDAASIEAYQALLNQ